MDTNLIFHLAIPCKELKEAASFYESLGSKVARTYEDRITINFFGHQVVCHLDPEGISQSLQKYPRHFGITFLKKEDFDQIYILAKQTEAKFVESLKSSFMEKPEEHLTFCIADPSNNILEFKHYHSSKMIY